MELQARDAWVLGIGVVLVAVLVVLAFMVRRHARALKEEQARSLEQRQRADLLMRATNAGFLEWDAISGKTTYTARFKEMLGYPSDTDDADLADFFALLHPEERESLRATYKKQIRDTATKSGWRYMSTMSYRLLRADGSTLWVHSEMILQTGPDGKTIRQLCSFIDISASKQNEAEISERAKFFNDVFDAVPLSLSLRDPEGRFLFVNRAWERYNNIRREEILGKTISFYVSEEQAAPVRALDRIALERGPHTPTEPTDFIFKGRRYLHTRSVMADSAGTVLGILVASLDTTERYVVEQALITEQRRLGLVVRAAKVGIVDWDGRTHATYYSPAFREIRGYPPDTDTSDWPDYFKVMIHPEDRTRVTTRFRNYIMGTGPEGPREYYEREEYRLSRADGSHVWVRIMGVCVRDDSGFATRFIAAVTDITEQRAQEDALRASVDAAAEHVRLREEVERIARHDLKTPLNSIVAAARLLRGEREPSESETELLDIIERAGYRVLSLVNLSFDIFRMERGEYRFQPQAVDMGNLIERIAADLRIHAVSKGVGLRLPAVGRSVHAWADELLCYSIMANLLKNAIEASPDSTAVTVTLGETPEAVHVAIHNPGAVPERFRARFFEKYSTSDKSGGLGLGTYSARLLARVQQGDIELRTSEIDGTTLEIRLLALPAGVQVPVKVDERSAVTRVAAAALPPLSVLVVDDDEYNLLVMRRYLPTPPLTVRTEANGRAAVDALAEETVDVIFMDLEMPVMNGYEAVARIRERERAAGRKPTYIVAFSSHDDEESKQRSLAAGCDLYLRKPAAREAVHRVLLEVAGGVFNDETYTGPSKALPAGPADVVHVDADLRETVPEFLRTRRDTIVQMGNALRSDDRELLRRLAHKLAGSFALYGFRWASDQSRAIEFGTAGVAQFAQQIDELAHHLDHVVIRYDSDQMIAKQ